MGNRFFLTTSLIVVAVTSFLAGGCDRAGKPSRPGPDTSPKAYAKTFALTYSIFFPSTHIQTSTAEAWAREVERRSQERLKITLRADGSLLEPAKTYDGVVQGLADLGMSCFAYTPSRFPLMEGLDLPLGYPDGRTATLIANAIVDKYRPKELDDVHVLYVHAHGPGVLATRKAVPSLEALKGLRIRAPNLSGKVVEKLGATSVDLPQNEAYEALRKGVVDGTLGPLEALQGWRLGEVVEAVTRIPTIGGTTTMFVVMNNNTWNSLPPDLQQVLTDVSREWAPKHGDAWNRADVAGAAGAAELGRTIDTLPEADQERAREAIKPIIDDYVKTTEAASLPGAQVLEDIRRLLKESQAPK